MKSTVMELIFCLSNTRDDNKAADYPGMTDLIPKNACLDLEIL
jgi:hypothetical protein